MAASKTPSRARAMRRAHLPRWRPRPGAQRRETTPRARSSGAASQLDPSHRSRASELAGEEGRPAHALADGSDPAAVRGRLGARMPGRGVRQRRGELCRLGGPQLRGGLAEVALARRADAVEAGAELDHVQIELEDAALGQLSLIHISEPTRLLS